MLKALQQQLHQLATDSEASLKKRFGEKPAYEQMRLREAELKALVLALPYLLEQLSLWAQQDHVDADARRMVWHVMVYAYHSVDVLPEEDFGFWGYLDDAYLASLAYCCLLAHHKAEKALQCHLPELEALQALLNQLRQFLPEMTETMDRLFQNLVQCKYDTFTESLVYGEYAV